MEIASDFKAARRAEEKLLREIAALGYSEAATFAIKLSLEESLNNAVRHGNHLDPAKKVRVVYEIDAQQAWLTIADEGEGFDPLAVPDPTADENLEKPGGRGLMLMRAYMDEVRFNARGNEVHLVKKNV